jgi:hypothetical protein
VRTPDVLKVKRSDIKDGRISLAWGRENAPTLIELVAPYQAYRTNGEFVAALYARGAIP